MRIVNSLESKTGSKAGEMTWTQKQQVVSGTEASACRGEKEQARQRSARQIAGASQKRQVKGTNGSLMASQARFSRYGGERPSLPPYCSPGF
ncbi:hypothetical protein RRG08_046763 [Elysia crispata]|uniref:Uncharacterized protein n=1 Tax=Elysia crispata TaxID=231223 RepID=A0AAE0ZWB6_9GAST|nr:hypothetical protein RRG08_046763 [Elysia crispata]